MMSALGLSTPFSTLVWLYRWQDHLVSRNVVVERWQDTCMLTQTKERGDSTGTWGEEKHNASQHKSKHLKTPLTHSPQDTPTWRASPRRYTMNRLGFPKLLLFLTRQPRNRHGDVECLVDVADSHWVLRPKTKVDMLESRLQAYPRVRRRLPGTSLKVFPSQRNSLKQGIWSSHFCRDLSQLVGCTPRDTPVPLYTRTSPWPRRRLGLVGAVLFLCWRWDPGASHTGFAVRACDSLTWWKCTQQCWGGGRLVATCLR